jgi:hypothetical protein
MYTSEVIRFLFSSIEAAAMIILSLTLFRIPLKYTSIKVLIITITLSCVSLFQRDYLHLENFVTISVIITYIILFKFLFNVPTIYSLLVSISGHLIFVFIQTLLVVIGTMIGLTTTHQLKTSLLHGSLLQFISATIAILLVIWMQRRKIGFMFVVKRFTMKRLFSSFNLLLSFVILLSFSTVQLTVISFEDNSYLIFGLASVTFVLIIALSLTYVKNKNDIRDKYERLKK